MLIGWLWSRASRVPSLERELADARSRIRALEESIELRDRTLEDGERRFALIRYCLELAEEILDQLVHEYRNQLSDKTLADIEVQRRARF